MMIDNKVIEKQIGHKRVFVTGMGVMNSIADSLNGFEKALRQGKQGIGFFQNRPAREPVHIGAEIHNFSLEEKINHMASLWDIPSSFINKVKKSSRRSPFPIKVALSVLLEAYIQAQLFEKPIIEDRLGIIVAGNNLTCSLRAHYADKFYKDPEYLSPMYALQYMDTDHVGVLSEIFGIAGEGCTVGGASASGNVGIIKAYQMLQLGIVDACIVIGALADLTDMELQGFFNIGALGGKKFRTEPEKACRPFDKEHEGFIYGQASGCLILESMNSVNVRQINPLAEVLGGKIVLDGNRLSNPSEAGEIKAMQSVITECNIDVTEVDYINAHGTSSPLGDTTELKAIKEVYGKEISRIPINSTKGLTGHGLYAAGVVEAIATIIQMRSGFIHPNKNLDNPIDKEFLLAGEKAIPSQIKIAMSNSFGFGGINTSILMKSI